MISTRGSRWTVLIGVSFVGLIFVGAGVAGSFLIGRTVRTTQALQERSINSVEVLSRIGRDLGQERVLIDDHIEEDRAPEMAALEVQLADVAADLRRAEQEYTPLVEPGAEAEQWHAAQVLIVRYHEAEPTILALSRANKNDEAHQRMGKVRRNFDDLEHNLYGLIQINHDQALEATKRIEALQRSQELGLWVVRLAMLLGLGLLGWWMVRRVGTYEEKIAEYTRRLEERNRDLDSFAGRVAHDIKSALGPIGLAPALLRRLQTKPERVLETADRIERSSRRATGVVDSLLAFSRAAQAADADESASLKDALKGTLDDLAPRAAELEVSIDVGDVPDVQIRCNAGLLQVVLSNLCGNAVKYVDGQPQRRVRISAVTEDSSCRIDIQDTGPGIPMAAQQRIFEPFYRVEGTRAPGTGIGLATVRRIVDARGGRVTAESTEGRGSTFRVWLPLAPFSTDQPPRAEGAAKPALRH